MNKSKRAEKLARRLVKKAGSDPAIVSQATLILMQTLIHSVPPGQRQAVAGAYMTEIARMGGIQLVHMGREVPCG